MDGYDDRTYGQAWAAVYDEVHMAPSQAQIDFLISLAGAGPILELAVGSGRVAIPLRATGVEVHGVEISPEMIERLRSKGSDIPIVAADMTDFRLDAKYPLVFLGFNTFFGPLEPERQAGILESVAAVLSDGGRFVLECFVPDLGRFDRNQTVRVGGITADRLRVDYSIHDPERQVVTSMVEFRWTDGRSALLPVVVRYLFPEQIDDMAVQSGLQLAERYEWYDGTPFTATSPRHVSVYTAG